MTTLEQLYLVMFVAVGIGELAYAAAAKRPRWALALLTLSFAAMLILIAAYWRPEILAWLGRWSRPLFAFVIATDIHEAARDIGEIVHDHEWSQRETKVSLAIGLLLTLALMAPAYYWALQVCWE